MIPSLEIVESLNDQIDSSEWSLTSFICEEEVTFYPNILNNITVINCYITLSRRPLFYVFNIIMPCVLLTGIGGLTFLMDVGSGERVSLSVTLLLALSVLQLVVMEIVPPTSKVIPLLGE